MENFPKDVLVLIALKLDLLSIINFSQTSEIIKSKVYDNIYFWKQKLKDDFKVSVLRENSSCKDLFLNKSLLKGINEDNLDLVKLSLDEGANINYKEGVFYPIVIAVLERKDTIFNYLLNHPYILDKILIILKNILEVTSILKQTQQVEIYNKMFDLILPKIQDYKTPGNLWKVTLRKLEEFNINYPHFFSDVYNRRIELYKKLAEK